MFFPEYMALGIREELASPEGHHSLKLVLTGLIIQPGRFNRIVVNEVSATYLHGKFCPD